MKLKDLETNMNPPKIVLYGPAGTGKTVFATSMGEQTKIYDLDNGLMSALRFKDSFSNRRQELEVFQALDKDPSVPQAFNDFARELNKDSRNARNNEFPYNILVIDSLTTLCEAALRRVRYNANNLDKNKIEIQHWGMAFVDIENALTMLRALPVVVVLIAHEYEQIRGEEHCSNIAVPGTKLPFKIPTFFDELWYCRIRNKGAGKKLYSIKTKGTPGYVARTRSNVADELDMNLGLETILKKMGYQFPS